MSLESALTKSTIKAVGVSFHKAVVSEISVGENVEVIPEPENTYDPNALAVRVNGRIAGHVPAALAARIATDLPALQNMTGVVTETFSHDGVTVGFAFDIREISRQSPAA